MKAERIDHVTIYVKDLQKAINFFSDLFGLVFSEPFGPEDQPDVTEVMDPLGLNLMAAKIPGGPMSRIIEHRGEGLSALTFKVPNIEDAITEMKSRGIRLVSRGNYGENAKWATFHPKDTFGVLLNLVEYHARHPYLNCFAELQKYVD